MEVAIRGLTTQLPAVARAVSAAPALIEKYLRQRECFLVPVSARSSFPFLDHLTLAQVAERERLTAAKLRGVILSMEDAALLATLNRRARPPLSPDPDPPKSAA